MKNLFIKKQLVISCALTLGMLSSGASAQINPAETGYLTDQRGAVVKSGFGLCWHYSFGPAPTSIECGAMKITEIAEPQPTVVAAMTPPVSVRVTLDADTLFDFDKAVLRPAGRVALDDFVAKTKDISPEAITVVGHADRFGSEDYNQRLSEKRAAAVRAYLLTKGIEPNRVRSEGKGELQPITKAGECSGAKSAKVIACLQPDRRVEIEIVGTRIER